MGVTNVLSPIKVGALNLKNRVVLAPMTRGRCGKSGLVNADVVEYYAQRSSAGLIISEGTTISEQADGWWGAPKIYRPEDVAAWKLVTAAVHGKGGRIFCQLWHSGRVSHSVFRPTAKDGRGVAPSAIKVEGQDLGFTPKGAVPHEVPRALTTEEVQAIPEQYRHAAECAKQAGFDGVELQCGGGYLLDTFLQSKTNKREDKYGGSLENRFRLVKECLEQVFQVFPSSAVAMRIGPNSAYNDMGSLDFRESFLDYAKRLSAMNLAFLDVIDGLAFGFHGLGKPLLLEDIRQVYDGLLLGGCGYTKETADKSIASGHVDMVAFGRLFMTNPDLVERFSEGAVLNASADFSVFYGSYDKPLGSNGYTDFPTLACQ
jgi:N-ethylmaleimide reductase